MATRKNVSTKNKVDYYFGDLSGVSTDILKKALSGYKLLLNGKHRGRASKAENAINRIEGELLGRKELKV